MFTRRQDSIVWPDRGRLDWDGQRQQWMAYTGSASLSGDQGYIAVVPDGSGYYAVEGHVMGGVLPDCRGPLRSTIDDAIGAHEERKFYEKPNTVGRCRPRLPLRLRWPRRGTLYPGALGSLIWSSEDTHLIVSDTGGSLMATIDIRSFHAYGHGATAKAAMAAAEASLQEQIEQERASLGGPEDEEVDAAPSEATRPASPLDSTTTCSRPRWSSCQ